MKKNNTIKGVRAKHIFIPTIIIILLMLMAFVVITIMINKQSEKDADDAHASTECISLISGLQGRSSSATETMSSFIYKPWTEPTEFDPITHQPIKFKLNTIPLDTYIGTITDDEINPHLIYETVKENYNIDEALLKDLEELVENLDYMDSVQRRAMYYISKVKCTDLPESYLTTIGTYTFTAEEELFFADEATTDELIKEKALGLIFEKTYALKKKDIADKINTITRILRNQSAESEEKSDALVWRLRRTLWIITALIIITLISFFSVLFKKLILPITSFAKDIQNNELLEDEKGLYEANYLAKSYNELLDKKSDFEHRLTAVAETDSLTGFENRYSYNKFLLAKADSNHPTCIFMLDINNLKYVNDTFGHDKGDELIKNSSLAIKETFYSYDKKNCYRLGGDEFIAILDNIKEDEIEGYIDKFNEKIKKYRVSIALGYAYTNDISKEGYETLMIEADKRMYENKKEMKKKLKEETE